MTQDAVQSVNQRNELFFPDSTSDSVRLAFCDSASSRLAWSSLRRATGSAGSAGSAKEVKGGQHVDNVLVTKSLEALV